MLSTEHTISAATGVTENDMMAPVRKEQPRQPSGAHVRVLYDRLIRVSRETPSSTQYSTRQRRGWEEPLARGEKSELGRSEIPVSTSYRTAVERCFAANPTLSIR